MWGVKGLDAVRGFWLWKDFRAVEVPAGAGPSEAGLGPLETGPFRSGLPGACVMLRLPSLLGPAGAATESLQRKSTCSNLLDITYNKTC